jgi:tetratricopeptide (TPR) repeat protein
MSQDSPPTDTTLRGSTTDHLPPMSAAKMLAHANAMAQRGRPQDAISLYRKLLVENPEFVPAHANLAQILNAAHRFAEAEPHFMRALAALPGEMPLLVGLAFALQNQSREGEAQSYYRQALAIQPDCVGAMLGLGICLRSESRLDEARECFEQALRTDPGCVDAYYFLATFKHIRAGDQWLAGCEALQPRVAAMPVKQQARYWFALGRMREGAARYDDAFAAYVAGNRARASTMTLDESAEDARLRRTREVFDARRLSNAPPKPATTARVPVFIVGMPRSGTSLVEQILASHPEVHGAGEIRDLREVFSESLGPEEGWPEAFAELSPEAWRELGVAYLDRVWRRAPQATRVVNKMTLNYRYLGAIRMMLPQARIVHTLRDPMDVCLSCYTILFDGGNLPYSYDLQSLGRYYLRYARLMQHWRETLPDGMLEVRYEELVTDLEAQVRRLLDHLGLSWDPRCLDFHRNARVVATASRAQVRRPVYRSSIGRWKHFDAHLGPLRELVEPWR